MYNAIVTSPDDDSGREPGDPVKNEAATTGRKKGLDQRESAEPTKQKNNDMETNDNPQHAGVNPEQGGAGLGLLHHDQVQALAKAANDMATNAPKPLASENLKRYRVTGETKTPMATRKLVTVQVRKPKKYEWFRTRTPMDGVYHSIEIDRETYLLAESVAQELIDRGDKAVDEVALFPSVNRQGDPFVVPIKISERAHDWQVSALAAMGQSLDAWTKMQANQSVGAYDVYAVESEDKPQWPKESDDELVMKAFKDRFIDTMDHPVIRNLLGE